VKETRRLKSRSSGL